MKIWAVAFNRTTGKKMVGPISLVDAQVTRVLDGIGSFTLTAELLDPRARALLLNETKIQIWTEMNELPRLVGTGIITEVRTVVNGGTYHIEASGPDILQVLKRRSTLLNRQYNDTLQNIASSLAALAGWTAVVSGSWPGISIRFDGQSAMSAILTSAKAVGAHVRMGVTDTQVEIGAFGSGLQLFVTNQIYNSGFVEDNDRLALIDSIQIGETSDAVATWLIPLGGGEGEAALTLRDSTRIGVLSATGPDGKPFYYIQNDAGIAQFGELQDTRTFKEITPIGNSVGSQTSAANNLYDVSKAWLDRYSQQVQTYSIRVKKLNTLVRPGDMIRVVFTGEATTEAEENVYLEIDQFFYVMKITETLGISPSATIEVSSVDRYIDTPEKVVAESIKEAKVLGLKPLPTATMFSDTIIRNFGAVRGTTGGSAVYWLTIDDLLLDVTTILFSFRTDPMEATVRPPTTTQGSGVATQLDMAMTRGTTYPSNVKLLFNGVDVSAQFGGPWAGGGASSLVVTGLDITTLIRNAGLKGTFKIELTCDQVANNNPVPSYSSSTQGEDSSGLAIMTVRALATTQAIK